MGSGASSIEKNSTKISKDNQVETKYGIKPEKLYVLKGGLYCNLDRHESKLSDEILKGLERGNNFSRDVDKAPNV